LISLTFVKKKENEMDRNDSVLADNAAGVNLVASVIEKLSSFVCIFVRASSFLISVTNSAVRSPIIRLSSPITRPDPSSESLVTFREVSVMISPVKNLMFSCIDEIDISRLVLNVSMLV